ncbi:16S rRNA (adenine(1518)-N(6)/adenine(1519)-N(6))-dimethyltransferase RsmA [Hazenella sp. IB182357]|uniref:Ribosomal RNA small subunit methyltransferase A n=1 Tax=Polycladospora coralii TaxID=2771432 RepID=A0A926NFA5_9BACL|nr:16S rRNA (adenine(1518)-N(6)/adenine(1519)-N(6))-dimethyltransferase RsmA [Polycladospora coralii]MBD1372474.1 16S rRNA (adenine(1518)-N(6)/adenine(1519)-N(6))-dimethyltransferase RsmA [Polycladospora coralii]
MTSNRITTQTRGILASHNIQLKKSLGQNFLTDQHVLNKIVQAAQLTEKAGVLEIGPGIGALTESVADIAEKVVAIEIDGRLVPILKKLFSTRPNVEIIQGDALEVDLNQIIETHFGEVEQIHVTANLPYYVTSPIIIRLLESRLPFKNIVIMIQKEVAERLAARPSTKAYGSLSVFVQYFAEVEMVAKVPSHVFVPRPQVDSAVCRLSLRSEPAVKVENESLFFAVIRAAFAQRRKTLLNTLHANLLSEMTKQQVENILIQADIQPKRRGETLNLAEFAALTQVIHTTDRASV